MSEKLEDIDVPTLIWCLKAAASMPSDPRHRQTLLQAVTVIEGQAAALRAAHLRGLMEAREIVGLSAWKHAGDDSYSQGMDSGARHQVRVSLADLDSRIKQLQSQEEGT